MAAQHRTEPPTPRRLRRARSEGDHPLSGVLITAGAVVGAALVLPYAVRGAASDARQLWELAATSAPVAPIVLVERVAWRTLPVVVASALGAAAVGAWQTGGAVSLAPLAWSWRRTNPWSLSERFDLRTRVVGCVRIVLGAVALFWAGKRLLAEYGQSFASSIGDARSALSLGLSLGQGLFTWALGVLLVLGVLDAFAARAAWYERLRMTREEVQREQKESEGDPGLKQARRRAHEELSKSADVQEASGAALLVIGGGGIAIALGYEPGRDAAPRVLMHASGAIARTLRAEAAQRDIPVREDTALARALFAVPVDEEIPGAHYAAVAEALSPQTSASGPRHGSTR